MQEAEAEYAVADIVTRRSSESSSENDSYDSDQQPLQTRSYSFLQMIEVSHLHRILPTTPYLFRDTI